MDLRNENNLKANIEGFDLVFHSAGPFKFTSTPMVKACLKTSTSYMDITGEIPVFEQNFKYDAQTIEKGIAIISGVDFDVIPTDCLVKYVSVKIKKPISLDIGKNMTIYFSMPKRLPSLLEFIGVSKTAMINDEKSRKKVNRGVEENIYGPDEFKRQTFRCYIWASVKNDEGLKAQSWLETMESYRFTAVAGVSCVEKIFELEPKGALTPELAFGDDFILEIPQTKRFDSIT